MPRPELQAPPEIFYNEVEARKYTTSSRIVEIQVGFLIIIFTYFPVLPFSVGDSFFELTIGKDFWEGVGAPQFA